MRIVCCVPMKLNNERLPNKNTMRMANGQPLCSFVLNTLRKVSNIDNIFVYCSDDQIKKHIPHDIHFLRRSASLDTNKTSMIEVLKSFSHDVSADIYVLVHVTAPFLKESSIESAICKVKDGGYDSAFSVEKFLILFGLMVSQTTILRIYLGPKISLRIIRKPVDFTSLTKI